MGIIIGIASGVGASVVTGVIMAVLNKLRIMPELKALAAGQAKLDQTLGSVKAQTSGS
jgi:hypothetical protein